MPVEQRQLLFAGECCELEAGLFTQSARHFQGGHMLFADGHVGLVENAKATTNAQDSRDPNTPGGDWNTAELIWDPMGPATDD